jgi:hypothetical protein
MTENESITSISKVKERDFTKIESDSYHKFLAPDYPDYPDYPDCDDIYNTQIDRSEIDSKYLFRTKASLRISKKHERIHI